MTATDRPECNWPKCRTARGLPGCFAWCKCRCHSRPRAGANPMTPAWLTEHTAAVEAVLATRAVAEPIVRARMAYYGYTPEEIADAENAEPHVAACWFNGMQWECYDENDRSHHLVIDELQQTAEFVMWVLEQPSLATAITAALAAEAEKGGA